MADKVRTLDDDRLSMLSRMSTAVVHVPKSDIQIMKCLLTPTVAVVDVLQALLILLGYTDTVCSYWLEFRVLFY